VSIYSIPYPDPNCLPYRFRRGHPLKDAFVRHCRTLMATGSSARSVREQLFVNAGFFLGNEAISGFISESMPQLRWFQSQREGLGNETLLYTFVEIARCDEVCQWGLDETSLNGIPTLNQWCRVKEGTAYRTLTTECAGLLTGSTASRVAAHVKIVWERGTTGCGNVARGIGGCGGHPCAPSKGWSHDGEITWRDA
jgi:hypothetical protein